MEKVGTEFTVFLLCIVCIVLFYFTQNKKHRAGLGVLAAILAGLAVFLPRKKDATVAETPTLKPDVLEDKREKLDEEKDALDARVNAAVTFDNGVDVGAVARLRAKLAKYRRRESLPDDEDTQRDR